MLKTNQITRASQEATSTNISLPENDSVLHIWTIIILTNKIHSCAVPLLLHVFAGISPM